MNGNFANIFFAFLNKEERGAKLCILEYYILQYVYCI